jgi:hypothetical protein
VFHPTGLREDLTEFLLGSGADIACVVKEDAAGTGSALVQGHDIFHTVFSFRIRHNVKQDSDFRPFLSIYQSFQILSSETDNYRFANRVKIVDYQQISVKTDKKIKKHNLKVEIRRKKDYNDKSLRKEGMSCDIGRRRSVCC